MRFTQAHQNFQFSRRMLLLGGAQAAFGGLLLGRLGYLSITQHQLYETKSEDNRVQMIVVPPRRGWLVDRNNKPMAINRSDFRIDIIPEQLEHPTPRCACWPSCSSWGRTKSTGSSRN